jgi:uncharacterized protein YkwD
MDFLNGLIVGIFALLSTHANASPIPSIVPTKTIMRISISPSQPVLPSPKQYAVLPTYKLLPTTVKNPTIVPTTVPTAGSQTKPSTEWGKAVKVGEDSYTMKVEMDPTMATPREIFQALNDYRASKGVHSLQWSDALATFAQGGADYYNSQGSFSHDRLKNFLEKEDGNQKLGFGGIGENGSYGYTLQAVHLIEWVFASDEGHDSNQLDSSWQSVGIGVSGTTVDIVFGGN